MIKKTYASTRHFGLGKCLMCHNGVHVHDPKCMRTGKYIGVPRDENKPHDVIIRIDDVFKYYKKKVSRKFLTDHQTKNTFTTTIQAFYMFSAIILVGIRGRESTVIVCNLSLFVIYRSIYDSSCWHQNVYRTLSCESKCVSIIKKIPIFYDILVTYYIRELQISIICLASNK